MSNNNPSPASSEESIIVVLHPEVPPYLPPTPSRPRQRPPPPAAQPAPLTPSAPRISATRPRPASEDFDDLELSEPAPKRQRKDLAKTPVKTPASNGQASSSVAGASKTSSSRPRASAVVTTPQQPPLASTIKAAAMKRTPKRAVLSSSEDDDEPAAPLRPLAPSPKYLAVRKTPKRAALSSSDEDYSLRKKATPLTAGSSTQTKAPAIKKPTTKKAAVAALKKPAAAAAPTPSKATRRRLSFSVEPEMTTSTSTSTTAANTTATTTPSPATTITKLAAGSSKSATPSKPAPSAPVSVTKKPARVPSPTKKPRVVPSWEYTDDPLPAVKGYDSGLAALESRGLLDPNAGRQLRGGRILQAPTGKKVTRTTRAKNRWGELEEKRDEEEATTGDDGDVSKEEGTTEDERPILQSPTKKRGRPPKKPVAATKTVESAEDEMDWDPIASLPATTFESLPAFSSNVATSLNGAVASAASQPVIDLSVFPPSFHQNLPSTKALVLSHLVGRTPPLPAPASSSSAPASSSLEAKGKERAATSPTQTIDDDDDEATSTLVELLRGTVVRGEGNSCLIQGVRGSGKTTVLNAALRRIAAESADDNLAEPPIVVRLSALLQKDDRAAIREIGRQVGVSGLDELVAEEDHVLQPTTLPAHLLSILTEPSRKAIVVVLDEFDLFAGFGRGGRQMLLYCLLDVVQSIRPSLGAPTSRGVAVVGLTSRIDTLHLLEKRVKSRFSHRIIRVNSPLNGDRSHLALARESLPAGITRIRFNGAIVEADEGEEEEEEEEPEPVWVGLVERALVPWERRDEIGEEGEWRRSWRKSVETVLADPAVRSGMNRLSWLTTDVRALLRPFIRPILELTPATPLLTPSRLLISLASQAESPGWGHHLRKLAGLSLPALCILAAVKDLGERGITEFTFEHLVFTYGEFAKAKLVGSGKARFGRGMLKDAFTHLVSTSLLFHASALSTTSASASSASALDFAKIRCAVPAFDIVEFFRGEGGKGVMTQLVAWGRKWDV